MTEPGFDAEVLLALRGARTVRLETSAAPERPMHTAIVWVVVDRAGRVLVRSWHGERGRWYRELRANPDGVLRVASHRVPIQADRSKSLPGLHAV